MPKKRKTAQRKTLTKAHTSLFQEQGVTGLKSQSGVLYEEFLRELQGTKGQKIYREMCENHPIISSTKHVFANIVRSTTWEEQPASESNEDMAAAEFLTENRDDLSRPFGELIYEIISGIFTYGWQFHETVHKRRKGFIADSGNTSSFADGKVAWKKFPVRSQETLYKWHLQPDGGIDGLTQLNPNTSLDGSRDRFIKIPIHKGLLFRTTTAKNNPEGLSLLRGAFVPWLRQKFLEQAQAIGAERQLVGLPMMRAPSEIVAGKGDFATIKNDLISMMSNVRGDEQGFVMVPSESDEDGNPLYEFSLISSPGTGLHDLPTILKWYDQRIAMSLLSDVIIIGHEKVGTSDLSKSKMELLAMALETLADGIEDIFNRIAIPRLFRLNGMNLTAFPKLRHGKIERIDIQALAEYISKLAGVGALILGDDDLENFLRETGGLPPVPEDRELPEEPELPEEDEEIEEEVEEE